MEVKAYAIQAEGEQLVPFSIERREPGPEEVLVELMFCGICHTDLVVANNESKQAQYPVVPMSARWRKATLSASAASRIPAAAAHPAMPARSTTATRASS